MNEEKVTKRSSNKIITRDVLKNVTIFGQHIDGFTTKINQIGSSIKNIILEGTIYEIEILELEGFGMIFAKLNDDTGDTVLVMCEKGNALFRELVSKIHEGQRYRVLGNIDKDLIVLVKKIKLLTC